RGLEVDRRLTDADQARAPSLDALEVLAVAGDARGVVDLGAFALQCAQLLAVRLRGLRLGREQGVKSAGDHERQAEGYQPGDAAARPARTRPAGPGDLLPGVSAPGRRRCHLRHLAVSSGVAAVLLSSPCASAVPRTPVTARCRSPRTGRSTRCRRSASSTTPRSPRWPARV